VNRSAGREYRLDFATTKSRSNQAKNQAKIRTDYRSAKETSRGQLEMNLVPTEARALIAGLRAEIDRDAAALQKIARCWSRRPRS